MVKMKIKGIWYTGQSVYECLCKAVRQPIDIQSKMVDVQKLIQRRSHELGRH